ncbi:MAG: radical SAM protein [Clostridia bacterium]|nr:radical SAM protein [Clostridia bacterium]
MREFKSFYKTVEGNEGEKCHYPTRLDTYGCGCQHDCKYCYAKSLLEFRDLWNPNDPSVADIKKIENKVKSLTRGSIVRLGGMTDCFQPCENIHKVTYKTIQLLNRYGIHYLIVTKSDLVASDEYVAIMDKNLAHIQITITSTNDQMALEYERATPSSRRIRAIEKLESLGFDVQMRLSPFIPDYVDLAIIDNVKCKRVIVEFLRVNAFIKRTFNLDYSLYTHKEGGYYHLPLETKKGLIGQLYTKEISVCEDCSLAYEYWQTHLNTLPDDCCNLMFSPSSKMIGNRNVLVGNKTAFLCSSTTDSSILQACQNWAESRSDEDIVISGFQSKAELSVLDVLLSKKTKIIMVLAKRMFEKCPQKYKKAVEEGRMLIISPFNAYANLDLVTKEAAQQRNEYLLNRANKIVIGYASAGGMLDNILKKQSKTYQVLVRRT